jgi:hypothetical protein
MLIATKVCKTSFLVVFGGFFALSLQRSTAKSSKVE